MSRAEYTQPATLAWAGPDHTATEPLRTLRASTTVTAPGRRADTWDWFRPAETMPRVRPLQRPAPQGPGVHRQSREIARRHQHRSPSPVRGGFGPARTAQVVALIPARNEAATIQDGIKALQGQERPPDRILVIANNCTDETADRARSAGADVLVMVANRGKKAGALNHALTLTLPGLSDDDWVFIQDADTTIVPAFLSTALACMKEHPRTVVSGRYACKAEHGLIGLLQRNEFAREGRRLNRRGNRTHIVVGTSCLFPVAALREVSQARAAGRLPGQGFVYDTETSDTEDFELTIALKTLGYRTMSPPECDAITDVMSTVPKLWHQRIRWMRGGFENLAAYGWTPVTKGFIGRQCLMVFGLASFLTWATAATATLVSGRSLAFNLAWLPITGLFVLDRVIEVRKAGRMAMLAAGVLLVEVAYDIFLHAVYVAAAVKAFRGTKTEWRET